MSLVRHFLGWDEPVVEKVRDFIVKDYKGGNLDFADTFIIVPTRQAGRRLKEALALYCDQYEGVLLSAQIVTPKYFLFQKHDNMRLAKPALRKLLWKKVVMGIDDDECRTLLPSVTSRKNPQWSLSIGEMIEKLREELADGGYTISSIVEDEYLCSFIDEIDRWNDLKKLEKKYLSLLKEKKMEDSCLFKIKNANSPELSDDIKKIIIAAVPDPSKLALRAFEAMAKVIPVNVLIHAPESMAEDFDDFGKPLTKNWKNKRLDIPGSDKNIFLESNPASQSKRAITEMSMELSSGKYSDATAGFAIAVPDLSVIPFLESDLVSQKLPAFNPADIMFKEHTINHLIVAMWEVFYKKSYKTVSALLRHPDFLKFLKESYNLDSVEVLSQLDEFQNYYLPLLPENICSFVSNPELIKDTEYQIFKSLRDAFKVIDLVCTSFKDKEKEFDEKWHKFFKTVYACKSISSDSFNIDDAEFRAAAVIVNETLAECVALRSLDERLDDSELSAIFLRRLAEQSFHRNREGAVIDLEGWLEIPWNDAQILIVTGVNDEFIPGGSMSDVFLPNKLRTLLNLRDDDSRFVRDVYLLRSMMESRKKNGRVCLILGKTSLIGDPLKPSRLLFLCSDEELPKRAKLLFSPVSEDKVIPPPKISFKLSPLSAEIKSNIMETKNINVTAFGDYLKCPFRFYLKHILGMEELSDEKFGLDYMDFGTIVHTVLETMGRDKGLWNCPDHNRLAEELEKIAEEYMKKRFGEKWSLPVRFSFDSAVQRLKAFAKIQVSLVREGWRINKCETKIKNFEYHGFKIRGKIDRIDYNTNDGRIRIIDYKTSSKGKVPHKEHLGKYYDNIPDYNKFMIPSENKIKCWVDLQLPLYYRLYNQGEFKEGIELAYINLPKTTAETRVNVWKEFNDDVFSSAMTCVRGVLEDITDKKFWPPAEKVKYDDFEDLFSYAGEDCFEEFI